MKRRTGWMLYLKKLMKKELKLLKKFYNYKIDKNYKI